MKELKHVGIAIGIGLPNLLADGIVKTNMARPHKKLIYCCPICIISIVINV